MTPTFSVLRGQKLNGIVVGNSAFLHGHIFEDVLSPRAYFVAGDFWRIANLEKPAEFHSHFKQQAMHNFQLLTYPFLRCLLAVDAPAIRAWMLMFAEHLERATSIESVSRV